MEAETMRIATMRLHSTGQWFVKLNQKPHYLGKDKPTAERRYRELIAEHYGRAAQHELPANCITVASLIAGYIDHATAACNPKWKATRAHACKQMAAELLKLYPALPAEDFSPKAYKAVRAAMAGPDRSHSYVNMLCTRLKAVWKWGVGEELVSESSYRRLLTVPDLQPGELGCKDAREVVPVSVELFHATLPYVSEVCADFLRLLWLSGARPGELIDLTPAELQEDGQHLIYRPRHHKTRHKNKLRAIVFGAKGIAILQRHWPAVPTDRFFACYSEPGVIRNAVYRACQRGNLQRWHPYQLRHAAVTRIALEHGKEVATAVAGHARASTTNRYDHGAVERAKKAAS